MKWLFYISLLISLHVNATKYYMNATSGSDGSSGTATNQAWQTWGRLMSSISSFSSGDSVLFNRGDKWYGYFYNSVPSGLGFGAYGTGGRPKITGLTDLTIWTETFTGSHKWETSCNSGLNLDLVLVGGTITPPGRTPNAGSYFNVDSYTNLSGGSGTITSTGTPVGTKNWTGAEAVIWVNQYNLDRDLITGHSSNTITYSSPVNPKSIQQNNVKFFIQKDTSTLDAQNEWYYFPATHILRMYSTVNPSTLNVQAATIDNFFYQDFKNNIGWDHLSIYGYDSVGVSCRFANKFNITNDSITYIGADVVDYDVDTACVFTGNYVSQVGNSGYVSRFSGGKGRVVGNVFKNIGIVRGLGLPNNQQHDAIMIENVGDSVYIDFNLIDTVGYCGIRYMGPKTVIRFNYVHSFGYIMSDGGGIYTNGEHDLSTTRLVGYNTVINGIGNRDMGYDPTPGGMPGIYFDDQSGNAEVFNNTIDSCTRGPIFMHNTKDINIHDNTIRSAVNINAAILAIHDAGVASPIALTGLTVKNNYISVPSSGRIFEYDDYLSSYSGYGFFDGNYYTQPSGNAFALGGTNYSFKTWQTSAGQDYNSTFTVASIDSIRLEFNSMSVASSVNFGTSSYVNLKTQGYVGNVMVAPYSALLLIRKTLPVYLSAIKFSLIQQ